MDFVTENFSKAHVQKAIGKKDPMIKISEKNVILSDDEGFIQPILQARIRIVQYYSLHIVH